MATVTGGYCCLNYVKSKGLRNMQFRFVIDDKGSSYVLLFCPKNCLNFVLAIPEVRRRSP
jgi:hypothetical protein